MSTKRKLSDSEGIQHVHESRRSIVCGKNDIKTHKKRRMLEPPMRKKPASTGSANAIKKRIRDLTRRLARPEISSAEVRIQDERALAVYQQELVAIQAEKLRQKMISKYHMVRFFERQKATRQLKKVRKLMSTSASLEKAETLKLQLHEAEVDLNYTMYHPLCETYISLFPPKNSSDEENSNLNTQSSKPPIWSEVEKAMADGTLQQLRDRTQNLPTITFKVPKTVSKARERSEPGATKFEATPQNRRQRRSQHRSIEKTKFSDVSKSKIDAPDGNHQASDSNNDSDGGFFDM